MANLTGYFELTKWILHRIQGCDQVALDMEMHICYSTYKFGSLHVQLYCGYPV